MFQICFRGGCYFSRVALSGGGSDFPFETVDFDPSFIFGLSSALWMEDGILEFDFAFGDGGDSGFEFVEIGVFEVGGDENIHGGKKGNKFFIFKHNWLIVDNFNSNSEEEKQREKEKGR